MTLLKSLLNLGILGQDAQTLEAHYGNVDPGAFLDGLEQIARLLTTKEQPGLLPPSADPWKSIFLEMLQLGDLEQAWHQYVGTVDPALSVALMGAVTVRMNELRNWLSQQAQAGKRRKTNQYIKALENLGYRFRYNLCTRDIEVNGKPLTDGETQIIRNRLRDINISEVQVAEDAYGGEAWKNQYHPVRKYLTGLQFDGNDPIGNLATHFTDEYGMFPTWLRRWLVGSVARVMSGEQNRVLVIDGPQGIGKSVFVKWLASGLHEYFYEGPVLPDDKDCRLRRASVWIWEVNEFGNTSRRADREALKAFLTTQMVRERKPYGKYDIQAQAMASFIGTVNNEMGILNDPTGSRRFMISHITHIDWAYIQIDVDQVWAQAVDLYLRNEPWNLEKDEVQRANEINEMYQMIDVVEETLQKYFEINPNEQRWWCSTLEILEVLKDPIKGNLKSGSEIDTRKLAAALTKLGLEKPKSKKIHNSVIRGYFGIQRRMLVP
jgi:predicted P-loop ATPase